MLIFFLSLSLCLNASAYDHKFYNMTPPKAKPLQKRQVKRMAALRDFKMAGFIGETDSGLLAIHDLSKVNARNQKILKKLVEDENKDRLQIFNEIMSYNRLKPEQKPVLIQNFFEVYRNTDPKGTFFYEKKVWQKHY
jgi:uncharacterized protein